jgi:hypothetical protein
LKEYGSGILFPRGSTSVAAAMFSLIDSLMYFNTRSFSSSAHSYNYGNPKEEKVYLLLLARRRISFGSEPVSSSPLAEFLQIINAFAIMQDNKPALAVSLKIK